MARRLQPTLIFWPVLQDLMARLYGLGGQLFEDMKYIDRIFIETSFNIYRLKQVQKLW